MATARGTGRPRPRPVKGANFEPKRVRKARRKASVRGYLANVVSDLRVEARDRAEFYRNLRLMKIRRRKIAAEMRVLAEMFPGVQREIYRVEDRVLNADPSVIDDAKGLLKDALTSVSVAADEWFAFSRSRIYYTGGSST